MTENPPGVDLAALRSYLDDEMPGFATGALSAERIAGGKSNLTYVLRADGGGAWVLRRPPLGHVLATAHDMAREYRVMSALGPTGVPVPETLFFGADPDVIGAPFYLMELVDGTVYRQRDDIADLTPERARAISYHLIDVLADLHDVDPGTIGLGDFGRAEGFLNRQIARWRKQLDASRSRDIDGIDDLGARLAETVPDSGPPAIVHGDYRLDNVIIGAGDQVAAVLDWEMATLGDPLADLGLFLVYWDGLRRVPSRALSSAIVPEAGFVDSAELMARYARRRSADLSRLPWYTAFGFFKLAVISEGIHFRYTAGQTVGAGFDQVGAAVAPLVSLGLSALAGDLPGRSGAAGGGPTSASTETVKED